MARSSSLSLQAWDGINQCECLLRVVTIGSGQLNSERNPATIADQMTFAAKLGPVGWIWSRLQPQKLRGLNCRPRQRVTNQSPRSAPANPAKRSGSVARCLPVASHVAAASRSCQNRKPVPVATSPTVFRCGARREFQSDKHDPASEVCLRWVCAVRAAVAVESDSTKHREVKE